jgi:long-chain acyl-CoA synthetase
MTDPAVISFSSMPAMLRDIAREEPDRVALREKEFGIWQETTYAGYWDLVQTAGMALRALGVTPGDRIAIHSENRIAWVVADLGAQGIQAASVGLYPTNPAPEVEYLLGHSESIVLIAEDQEQVDKALEVKERLPALRTIVYLEPRGVRTYDDPMLMSWEDFLDVGRRAMEDEPGAFDALVDGIDADTAATLVYTSGTTGPPKGAILTHRNLVWTADRADELLVGRRLPSRIEMLSYLPLCHVFEKAFTLLGGLKLRATVNFAESIDTVVSDLREIQPTTFPAPPRILEKMSAGVMIRVADASRLKRITFGLLLRLGKWNTARILRNGSRGLLGEAVYRIGWLLGYRVLQKHIGMQHCLRLVSGSAPIAPEVLEFFMSIGVPTYEAWGMTETTAYGTINPEGNVKLGTIGTPNRDVEIRIDADGEILIRHPSVFHGYFKNPEATAEAIDAAGWLHTGDVGEWDGEHIRIVDRKKDIIITSGGKNISPSEIENKLKVSPFIKEAIVIGDGRKFVSTLIGIEFDTVSSWAQRHDITFTTYRDLSEKPEVIDLIRREVERANRDLARVEQVKQFRLIPKELDHDQGELTATQKVKRSVIEELFGPIIEEIYA